jgi:hypothetical protein
VKGKHPWEGHSGCLIELPILVSPNPGQQFVEPLGWMCNDARQDISEPGLWIQVVHFSRLCRPPNYAESGRFPQISG